LDIEQQLFTDCGAGGRVRIVLSGICFGLGAAFCQSLSYVFSGLFVRTFQLRPHVLLVLAHVAMGLASVVALPLVLPDALPGLREYGGPLVGGVVCYLSGQTGLFLALRHTDASRVSPLLGLKLPVLAGFSVLFLGAHYVAVQWLALGLCLLAALLLNVSGPRIRLSSLGWILWACLGYCASDLNIRLLVDRLQGGGLSLLRACLVGGFLSYTLCGALALALLPLVPWREPRLWRYALPFAAAWLGAMLLLFACFGAVGVVFGNIVQSTRGLLSILLGLLLSAAGHVNLEARASASVWLRRLLAAVLMVLSIALFSHAA
jgi:hypothetical protein